MINNTKRRLAVAVALAIPTVAAATLAVVALSPKQSKASVAATSATPSSSISAAPSPTSTAASPSPSTGPALTTYVFPIEGLHLTYPRTWKVAPFVKHAGDCTPVPLNCDPPAVADSVTMTAPGGLELGIQVLAPGQTPYLPRMQGQGCVGPQDTCQSFSTSPITIAGKNAYLDFVGYKNQGFQGLELDLSATSTCIQFCRGGLGRARAVPGEIQVYALYPARYDISADSFQQDPDVLEARSIIASLTY
jgi:hypothetical protein